MADDNNSRYRTSDPYGREPAQAAPANDPLAELARLIGQSDPFSEFGRDQRQPAAHDPGARYSEPAQQGYAPEPEPQYADPSTQRYAGDFPPRFADSPQQQSLNDWPGSPPSSPPQPQQHDDWPSPTPPPPPAFLANLAADPYGRPAQQSYAPQPGIAPYDHQPYADPHSRPGADSYQQADHHAGFEPQPFTPAQAQQAYSQPIYPHEPEAGSMPPPHDDEFYDDAPRSGRRKGMLTVAAVLALAVVGTAGAFGYRSLFSGPGSSSPPPVIRASNEPSKVAPPASPNVDPSAGKISYDRFNDAGKDEQVVKREEKPVDVPRVSAAPPRTVFPGAPVPSPSRSNSGTTAANPPSAIGEPRRVRTVPIRPDAGDIAANASESAMPLPPPRQASAPARTADVESDPAPAAAAASRASSRNARVAARSTPTQSEPAPAANAPLSLSPDANNSPSLPPPSAPQREASRAPAPSPRSTASTASSGGGGYLVQVSSQKSEADAQSSFRGIQSKYASVLNGQPHTVRRADLGSKGVYYRAMVGPYGSREEAIKVCSSLKQAGGDCVVQH